jgi:hypothetical protein
MRLAIRLASLYSESRRLQLDVPGCPWTIEDAQTVVHSLWRALDATAGESLRVIHTGPCRIQLELVADTGYAITDDLEPSGEALAWFCEAQFDLRPYLPTA